MPVPPAVPQRDAIVYERVVQDDFEDEHVDEEDTQPTRLPVPEPEAQPLQRPAAAAEQRNQRPIRRMDPKALDIPRNNRNAPPGDVIDIPAFLRKR